VKLPTAIHPIVGGGVLPALLLFGALSWAMLGDAYRHFERHGGKDWNCIFGQAQAELVAVREHGELPLWNPWRGGGQPSLAQPTGMLLSPITPLVLAFGVVAGFKLALIPIYVVGCLGMWVLAGSLGLRGPPRYAPALVFFGSSIFPLYTSGGLPNWLVAMAALPWLFWCHRRALDQPRYAIGVGALLALTLLSGAIDRFIVFPLLLGIDALIAAVSRRSAVPLWRLSLGIALAVGLAAIKLLPLLEIYLGYPREMPPETRSVPPEMLLRLLLDPHAPDLISLTGAFVTTAQGGQLYWINAGAYIGPLALLLVVLGAASRIRQSGPLLLNGALFVWLALGTAVPISLWAIAHELPGFASLRGPERQMMPAVFFLALLAGFGTRTLERWLRQLLARALPRARARLLAGTGTAVLLGALAFHLVQSNSAIVGTAFIVDPPGDLRDGGLTFQADARAPFRQASYANHPRMWRGPLWEAVVRNEGNVAGMINVPIVRRARPHDHPRYRGEVWIPGGEGTAEIVRSTANSIRVRARLASAGHLVVNQNFDPGWEAEGREVEPFRGLISLALPAGQHDVLLRYRPAPVVLGAAVSLLTAGLGLAALRLRRDEPPAR